MNFDQIINRRATNSAKWTVGPNELPLSIADMDFPTAPAIVAALQAKVATGRGSLVMRRFRSPIIKLWQTGMPMNTAVALKLSGCNMPVG